VPTLQSFQLQSKCANKRQKNSRQHWRKQLGTRSDTISAPIGYSPGLKIRKLME
jgi:hypothetical protein